MPAKLDSYQSYGQKLISLFARLLFSSQKYSLTDLSIMMNCSKQTVLRLIGDIDKSYGVTVVSTIEGNRKYFQIKKPGGPPPLNLTESEIYSLQMCQAFARHLLGDKQFEESSNAIYKTIALSGKTSTSPFRHFGSIIPGSIDYTPHQETIRTLIEAMEQKKVCGVTYRRIGAAKPKRFFIKPLKLFSFKDTIYLHARLAKTPGKKYVEPEYDPLLAIHRFHKVDMTNRPFEFPPDYDFEKVFNQNFGIIKDESFKVEVEFSGFASEFVTERIWSPDQKIVRKRNGNIELTFTASSEVEVVLWILSFDGEAKVMRPKWLIDSIKCSIDSSSSTYT